MLKFSFDNHRVIVDPLSIATYHLKEIWDADRTRDKREANKLLTYVHLVSQVDQDAPYFKSAPDEVRILAKRDVFGSYDYVFEPEQEDFLEEAIAEYQKANEDVEYRLLTVYSNKIDQLKDLLETTKPKIRENVVKGATVFSTNTVILNKIMMDINKLLKEKETLMNRLKKDGKKGANIRGNRKLSRLEEQLRREKQRIKEQISVADNLPSEEI